jgi:hypothetical protein
MPDHEGLSIDVSTRTGKIRFPETGTLTLKSGSSAIFPFNIAFSGVNVRMATVQPFCHFVNDGKNHHVLVSIDGIQP